MPRTLYLSPVYSKSSFDHQARETCGSEEANLVEKTIYFSYEVAVSSKVFKAWLTATREVISVDETFTTIKDDLARHVTDNQGKKFLQDRCVNHWNKEIPTYAQIADSSIFRLQEFSRE